MYEKMLKILIKYTRQIQLRATTGDCIIFHFQKLYKPENLLASKN